MKDRRGTNRALVPALLIGGLGAGLGIGLWLGLRGDPGEPERQTGAGAEPWSASAAREEWAARIEKRRDEERGQEDEPVRQVVEAEEMVRPEAAPPPPHPDAMKAEAERQPPPASEQSERTPESEERERERFWRERAAALRDRLVTTYEACLAQADAPHKDLVGDGKTLETIDTSAFAEAKAMFLSARSALGFLQDEARRAGVPPGWVRIDWNSYPRTPNPEDGTCERTLPEEIPPR